jgi:hypothetical protein
VPVPRVVQRCSAWSTRWSNTRLLTDGGPPAPLRWTVPAGRAAHATAVTAATHGVQLTLAAMVMGVALRQRRLYARAKRR